MERHAAFIKTQNMGRVLQIVVKVVKQNVENARAHNDAQGDRYDNEHDVVDAQWHFPATCHAVQNQRRDKKTEEIGQTVPAYGNRTYGERNRVKSLIDSVEHRTFPLNYRYAPKRDEW